MSRDYIIRCDCGYEMTAIYTITEGKRMAKQHLDLDKCTGKEVFLDEYNLKAGELSGRYWKINK